MNPERGEPRPTVPEDAPLPVRVPDGARRYTLDRFHVAGFRHHDGPALVHALRADEPLDLVPEPDNPHDPFAVALTFMGAKLGYVPREWNRCISRLLRQGAPLRGRVVDVDAFDVPWQAVKVEVVLDAVPLPAVNTPAR